MHTPDHVRQASRPVCSGLNHWPLSVLNIAVEALAYNTKTAIGVNVSKFEIDVGLFLNYICLWFLSFWLSHLLATLTSISWDTESLLLVRLLPPGKNVFAEQQAAILVADACAWEPSDMACTGPMLLMLLPPPILCYWSLPILAWLLQKCNYFWHSVGMGDQRMPTTTTLSANI